MLKLRTLCCGPLLLKIYVDGVELKLQDFGYPLSIEKYYIRIFEKLSIKMFFCSLVSALGDNPRSMT